MQYRPMRTTIEIKPEHRARLLELAARRGHKGSSQLIGEALDNYLQTQMAQADAQKRVRMLKGALSAKDAAALRSDAAALRDSWR
jgi:predicted transcriptional regulator